MRFDLKIVFILFVSFSLASCSEEEVTRYDTIIRGGLVYDGSGNAPYRADVALNGDRIVFIGDASDAVATTVVDAKGQAVSPGFINMLSWAPEDLIYDGRSMGDIYQGVTLEVFGEGSSMGPLTDEMAARRDKRNEEFGTKVGWRSLGEYFDYMDKKGMSPNIASFVGTETVRIHEIGYADRAPSAEELARMTALVDSAMKEGALGVGSSLIYAPAFYAKTDELIELSKVAAKYNGMYISHIRNEGNGVMGALDEFVQIVRDANIRGEVYHLKASGKNNWDKLDDILGKLEAARAEGLEVTADMYNYPASSTGLDAAMPPWVQEGGYDEWVRRLRDPAIAKKVISEMSDPDAKWDNAFTAVGGGKGVMVVGFRNKEFRKYIGMRLSEIADDLGMTSQEAAIYLVINDGSRVQCVYFGMTEENIRKKLQWKHMSFGSDGGSMAPEGLFLESSTHPRAYGNFARLLGDYVRDAKLLTLEEAVRKLTSQPAHTLRLKERGSLKVGYYADVVIFDPKTIDDRATFEDPHQLSVGVSDVFVNGVAVLKDGEHTGAMPGRALRGPGWTGWE